MWLHYHPISDFKADSSFVFKCCWNRLQMLLISMISERCVCLRMLDADNSIKPILIKCQNKTVVDGERRPWPSKWCVVNRAVIIAHQWKTNDRLIVQSGKTVPHWFCRAEADNSKCPLDKWKVTAICLCPADLDPANTRRLANADLMLGQRRRRWPNIKPALVKRFVFAGSMPLFGKQLQWRVDWYLENRKCIHHNLLALRSS